MRRGHCIDNMLVSVDRACVCIVCSVANLKSDANDNVVSPLVAIRGVSRIACAIVTNSKQACCAKLHLE